MVTLLINCFTPCISVNDARHKTTPLANLLVKRRDWNLLAFYSLYPWTYVPISRLKKGQKPAARLGGACE